VSTKLVDKKKDLKKHVATIHCANTFSLLQRKIYNALLYHAYPHMLTREEHQITVRQLCDYIGYSGNNQAVIKTALRELVATVIEWDVIDSMTGDEDWTASTVVASVRLQGAVCTYAYSPRMRELLYSPAMYGKINLIVQARFKSSYGLALYENCARYRGLPQTKWFEMPVFRKIMGVAEDNYPIFRDFKKRVLDKSIEEVNTCSDIQVEPDVNRVGRKVTAIRFKLREREKKVQLGLKAREGEGIDHLEPEQVALVTKLVNDFGMPYVQACDLLKEFSLELINQKIDIVVASNSYKTGKIKNLTAYLLSALKANYQPPMSSQVKLQQENLKASLGSQEKYLQELNNQHLQSEYEAYVQDFSDRLINTADSTLRAELLSYLDTLFQDDKSLMLVRDYKRNGIDGKIIRAYLRQYLRSNHAALFQDMLTLDEFIAQTK
jgi:plasmid replication initiation protein